MNHKSKMTGQTELMASAPVMKAILTMSIPVVLGMMVSMLYNLVDTFFIGRLHDPNQLSAANLASPVSMLMMAIATIVSTGAASYISRCLGQWDENTAHKTLSTGFAICTGLGLLITVLGVVFIKPLVSALGATEDTFVHAYNYVLVMCIGTIPVMLSYAGGQLVRAEGAAMPAMVGMLIGTLANIILDPIFIFVFKLKITGAAIATVLGNVLATVYYLWYYLSGRSMLHFRRRHISGDRDIWAQIFGIGIPAALSQLLVSFALVVCNNLAKPYGEAVRGGMGVAAKLMYIGTFIFMGFSAGCQPLVGFNYGAKNLKRVAAIIRTGMLLTFVIGAALTLAFGFFADGLVSAFSADMPEVIQAGATVLRTYMWSFLVLGPQMLASTTIQAFGKAKASLVLSIARQGLFYIPLLLLLNRTYQLRGLLWAQPISDLITMVLGITLLALVLKKSTHQTEAPRG